MTVARNTAQFQLCKEFYSRIEEVDAVCREIRTALREKGLESAGFVVELIARECLNNAVLHGNGGNAAKRVVLHLMCRGTRIRLQVADEGPGFDWRNEHAQLQADLDASSGRGLSIVRAYADRVSFNPRGNQITLWLCQRAHEKQEKI